MSSLRYVTDASPGIVRRPHKGGFHYLSPDGDLVKDASTLARIKRLAVPPAWRDVWICLRSDGHIQAIGRDAKGRKQYRYHPEWRHIRDEAKFERMIHFANALPNIRRHVDEDLASRKLVREKVLATVVYLLEATLIRIGNQEYAQHNHSFGLTTLRNRHVRVDDGEIEFRFQGKSGIRHIIKLDDPRLVRIISRVRELPGQELFQYLDDAGEVHNIGSDDVNDYLRELSGTEFSAKDFRTWIGSVHVALMLQKMGPADSASAAKKNVSFAIETVARQMGNTPSVCRKCYVHPAILDSYLEGSMLSMFENESPKNSFELTPIEKAVLRMLESHAKSTDSH
jgi:DNA topoisomerase I